jgi:hypothetical protein
MAAARLCFIILLMCSPTSVLESKPPSPQVPRSISETGNDFLYFCKHTDDTDDSRFFAGNGICLGWVQGFTQGITISNEFLQTPQDKRMTCPPDGVTFGQDARIIYKYISDHPERAHLVTRYLASEALIQAFPCKK